ncbi:MAG: MFS transporter [Alistipes sp.]
MALLWLWLTPIRDIREKSTNISFRATFDLLRDSRIVAYFIGILVLVGVDVGMNMTFPKLLMERCGLELTDAGMGNSVYFFARTVGAFLGGILLMKYSESKFFTYSTYIALLGLVLMLLSENLWFILGCVAVFGVGYANLFSIIFSLSLKRVPKSQRSFGVADRRRVGRRVLPPLLGVVTDLFATQLAAVIMLAAAWLYMVWLTGKSKQKHKS